MSLSVTDIRAIYIRTKITRGLNKSRTTHINSQFPISCGLFIGLAFKPGLILAAAYCELTVYTNRSLT
jgi:hypothetical protein